MRIFLYLKILFKIAIELWPISKAKGIHWHIVGFNSMEQYDVIFEELHAAHLRYEEKLKVSEQNKV